MATKERPPLGLCSRCGKRWWGTTQSHCRACCESFTGPTGFDRHRRGGQCLNPADVGLVSDNGGWWGKPADDTEPWASGITGVQTEMPFGA